MIDWKLYPELKGGVKTDDILAFYDEFITPLDISRVRKTPIFTHHKINVLFQLFYLFYFLGLSSN